eukprot:Tamp_11144.p1 GENE.Tamp_11144~~Tamp_11144.p1  ORF type:complete len:546 (+),score=114.45 Tamp_11144:55-1692(+)
MAATGPWKLRAELLGHEQDVRGVNNSDTGLVTCSRDKTIRLWTPVDARSYESSQVLIGHEHFVACAVQLPASPAHPSGAIASGGYDRTMSGQTIVKPVINIWEAGAIVATLEGHTLTVCGIAVTPSGHMVSVSWDKTARVWDLATRQCVTVMMGHEQAVWAVLCLEDGRMLTASADKTIKRWNGATCEHTYVGHSDCVRALAMMPGIGFLSTGNDCSIRMWAVSGECLMTMSGHESFVYSLAVLPTGEVVSGSEDRTARVWRDGKCVGTIAHGGSVWSVAALPDGDIATGCADSVARVFTRDASKVADEAVLQAHEAMIKAQTVSAQEVGGMKMDQLPGTEALEVPGDKDGQTKIVRIEDKAYAYSWNSIESKWDQVGTVVDGPGGGGGGGGGGGRPDREARRMAFNNPSSRTPVSYGSATKSLGYIVGTIGRAFSSDDDEGAHLLNKKKAKGESRFMAGACCCCLLVLTGTVAGFIWALQSMTYPGEIPKGAGFKGKFDPRTGTYRLRTEAGSRGRSSSRRSRATARAQRNLMDEDMMGADLKK